MIVKESEDEPFHGSDPPRSTIYTPLHLLGAYGVCRTIFTVVVPPIRFEPLTKFPQA